MFVKLNRLLVCNNIYKSKTNTWCGNIITLRSQSFDTPVNSLVIIQLKARPKQVFVALAIIMKLSLGWKKLILSWMLHGGSRIHIQNLGIINRFDKFDTFLISSIYSLSICLISLDMLPYIAQSVTSSRQRTIYIYIIFTRWCLLLSDDELSAPYQYRQYRIYRTYRIYWTYTLILTFK